MPSISILRTAVFATLCGSCFISANVKAEPVNPRNVDGSITKSIPQTDGKVIIIGSFSYVGSVERPGIARLQPDGTLDLSFGPGAPNGAVNLVALQSDGKVLIAGLFTRIGAIVRNRLARLNSDGTLDAGFDPGAGPSGDIYELLIDSGNQAVLAGTFQTFNGVTRNYIARLNTSGTVDPSDAGKNLKPLSGTSSSVQYVAFCPDGRLIVAGLFGAGSKFDLARVALDGTLDETFPSGLSISALAVQPNGKVLVSGFPPGRLQSPRLYRLNADGTVDTTFRPTGDPLTPSALRLQPDGRILVRLSNNVQRITEDGIDDPTFAPPQLGSGRSPSPSVTSTELQTDGRILISGSFNSVNGMPRFGAARLFADGSVDPEFVPAPTILATGFVLNLSTRATVGTGDNVLIGGFIVDGTTSKKVIIRAIGPSLAGGTRRIANPLPDPRVTLRNSRGEVLAENDNWHSTQVGGLITSDQAGEIEATGIPPKNDADSTFIVTLDPGAYTAVVEGVGGGTGTALVEIYDLDGSGAARIANISTRGTVSTGDDVVIGGVILGGTHPTEVLVRAIGPSLTTIPDALADPTLVLYDANGSSVGVSDNWKNPDRANIERTQAAPTNDKEAAILMLLQPGNYTAVVRGANATIGTALVEFYAL